MAPAEKPIPEKPLATEPCAIAARAAIKEARKKKQEPLCGGCDVNNFSICNATGHVLCSRRKAIGWIPVPFNAKGCGLYAAK